MEQSTELVLLDLLLLILVHYRGPTSLSGCVSAGLGRIAQRVLLQLLVALSFHHVVIVV